MSARAGERWALLAFALISALSILAAVLFARESEAEAAPAPAQTHVTSTDSAPLGTLEASREEAIAEGGGGRSRGSDRGGRFEPGELQRSDGEPPCATGSPPVYPGAAIIVPTGDEERLTDLVSELTGLALRRWSSHVVPRWIGITEWYDRRMDSIPPWEMGPDLRRAIGMRVRGVVDAPPVLYHDESGAVLIRLVKGNIALVVACP